jgi:hypothetical protein
VGATAQDLLQRVGSRHKWNQLVTAADTTVTTYEVIAKLDVAASGRGTLLSARNEALRSAEQTILNKIIKENKVRIKNVIDAVTEAYRKSWAETYKVQIGEPNLTLRGGVKVSTSAASGAFALLGIFDIIREEKMSHYIYAPYVLEDQGGIFTLQMQDGGWFRGDSYWKNYISGPMGGQKSYTDKSEFDFWKKEGELLWGTTDFWGNFMPGFLNPRLPVIDPYRS